MSDPPKIHEPEDRSGRDRRVDAFRRRYELKHWVRHVANAHSPDESPEEWRRHLETLEARGLLASQVEQPDGFAIGARQLERHVLPAAARIGEWQRFFRYLLTAANLRDLAETLDDPVILQALARSGRLGLAEALVGRLPVPEDRARCWALLAAVPSPADPAFERLASALRTELDRMPEAVDSADEEAIRPWSDALASAGRSLAPRLRARWTEWIGRLAPWPDLADQVRLAVADGFFEAGESDARELWEALAEIESPERLLRFLPGRVQGAAAADPGDVRRWLGVVRTRLPRAGADPRLLWLVGLALLSCSQTDRAAGGGATGWAEWSWLRSQLGGERSEGAVPWDRELLERGGELWPRLEDDELAELACEMGNPGLAARLRVLVAEGRREPGTYRSALAALWKVGDHSEQLSLYLRALQAAPETVFREVRSRVRALLAHLAEVQYAVPPEDLCRALDLVARHLPRQLRRTVEGALSAPETSAQTLRALVKQGAEEGLLRELLNRAETYAAMATENAAQGFELRAEVLILLGCRLARDFGDPKLLTDVADRLLPEEEDRLRATGARLLRVEQPELVEGLCAGIRDRRLRLRTRLEALPEGADPGDLVAPRNLYRAAARFEAIEDELRALGGLLDAPERPARSAVEHFEEIESLGRRVEALADLARHTLRYQSRRLRPDRQDRLAAVLPLKEALGVVESDRWLVSLTPELVSIGGHLGTAEAVAEVQEAVEQAAGFDAAPEGLREQVLIELLGRAGLLLLDEGPDAPLHHVPWGVRRRRAVELVTWLARLPDRAEDRSAGRFLRQRWHRLLPPLVALGERVERRLPGRRIPLLPFGWLERFRTDAAPALEASARRALERSPADREVFDLCLASPPERRQVAERLGEGSMAEAAPETFRALAWLLVDESPERVCEVLAGIESAPERDRAVLELLRCAPLPGETARKLLGLLSTEDDGARDRGAAWLGVRYPGTPSEAEWSTAVARLISRDRLDPGDPETTLVRRRLWAVWPEEQVAQLGQAALRALATGGGAAGMRAARLFLNAFVAPSLGEEASEVSRRRHAQMLEAVEQARSLETPQEPASGDFVEPGGGASGPVAPKRLLERLLRWMKIWNRRPLRPGQARFHQAKGLALLTGMAALPVLPQLQPALFGWTGQETEPATVAWAIVSLALLATVHGLLTGCHLSWATPGESTVRRPVRWLRTALATVPLVGLWTVPAWRWILAERDGAVRRDRRPGENSLSRLVPTCRSAWKLLFCRVGERLGRWAGRQAVFVSLFAADLVVLTVTLGLLVRSGRFRVPMIWGAALAHLVCFGAMLGALRWWVQERKLSGWRAMALPSLSVFWLVPIPGLPLAGLLGMILLDSEAGEQSLGHRAFAEGRGVGRLPVWSRLETRIRRGWDRVGWRRRARGLPQSVRTEPEPTLRERRLLWFFQAKGAVLFLEGSWLAGGLVALAGGKVPTMTGVVGGLFSGLEGLSVFGGLAALAGLGIVFVREVLGRGGAQVFGARLFWAHLMGAQLALVCGLEFGAGLALSDLDRAGGALLLLGLGGAVLQVGAMLFGMLLRSVPERWWETRVETVLKVIVYVSLGVSGQDLMAPEPRPTALVALLEAWAPLAPDTGAVFGLVGLQWLIGPKRRQDLWSPSLPWRQRLSSLLLVVSALVPLGGLAIPWWIRRRWLEVEEGSSATPSPKPGRPVRKPS